MVVLCLTRLPYHLDEDLSGLSRVPHLSQERDARTLHAILRLQPQVKAKAIDGSQCSVLRLNTGILFREQDKCMHSGFAAVLMRPCRRLVRGYCKPQACNRSRP